MEDKKEENSENNSQNVSTEEKTLQGLGYLAKINGEIFNPGEVSILIGDPMTREITQVVNYLCESYPIEAISYCLQRCYLNTFSKTSLLDKIVKYLLTKYEEGEDIITDLLFAYKENTLNTRITSVNQFNSINNTENRQLTKLVFYDSSKDGIDAKRFMYNEIFIEIDEALIDDNNYILEIKDGDNSNKDKDSINKEKDINDHIISLDENEDQANFLCAKHHLFKRFSRRGDTIYVYNFIGFEKETMFRKKKYSKKIDQNNNYQVSFAVFMCDQKGCNAKYRYNFCSNVFRNIIPHNDDCPHRINENAPWYYKENINILKEKEHITDIQLVRTGK